MKVILDTHTFLWGIDSPKKLSERARATILDIRNEIHLSRVSLWEIAIKVSLKKLALSEDWYSDINREMINNGFKWLNIDNNHCLKVAELPFHHRDPFDRLIISQAITEKMGVVSNDNQFTSYEVNLIW